MRLPKSGELGRIRSYARVVTSHGFRCHECPNQERYNRGCTRGYTEARTEFESMPPQPTTCPVITEEPPGFWTARNLAVSLERGSPVFQAADLTAGQVAWASLVNAELQDGERRAQERAKKAADVAASLVPMMEGQL